MRVKTSRPDSVRHAAASGGPRHNGAVTIEPYDWFPEAKATSDTEARFLDRLRQLAARWSDVGLSPAKSAGAPVGSSTVETIMSSRHVLVALATTLTSGPSAATPLPGTTGAK